LLKNRKLARSFSDAALGKLLNLLTSKVEQRGGQVIKVNRFFPSTKTCHCCGWKWEDMDCLIAFFSVKTRRVPITSSHRIVTTMAASISYLKPSLDRAE
jgi:transposase